MSGERVEKLLERVALQVASLHCQPNEVNMDYAGEVLAVLEERLGPLLRAGHELYMEEWGGSVGGDNWIEDSAPGRYVAALAALEREHDGD